MNYTPNPIDLSEKIIQTLEGKLPSQVDSIYYDEIMKVTWEEETKKIARFIKSKLN